MAMSWEVIMEDAQDPGKFLIPSITVLFHYKVKTARFNFSHKIVLQETILCSYRIWIEFARNIQTDIVYIPGTTIPCYANLLVEGVISIL